MFGIGGFELFIILIFGFLIFGPEKLPEIARTVGKAIARFKQAQDEMNDVIKSTDIYDPNSDEPFKDPMEALDKLAKHQEEKAAQAKQETAKHTVTVSRPSREAQASAADAAAPTSGTSSQPEAADAQEKPRQESFTERKARYERERAARKAAQEAAEAASDAPAHSAQAEPEPAQEAAPDAQGGDE